MNLSFQYIVLSIVQGITEAFPISSSLHVLAAAAMFRLWKCDYLLEIAFSLSSLIAFTFFFRNEVINIIKGIFIYLYKRKITDGLRLFIKLSIATLPCVMFVLCVKYDSCINMYSVVLQIIMTILFFIASFAKGSKKDLSYRDALIAGIFQISSIFAGSSRLGSCLTALLFLQYEKTSAIKYAFLIGIPSIFGSMILHIHKLSFKPFTLQKNIIVPYIIYAIIASSLTFIFMNVFIKWKNGIKICALYRIFLITVILFIALYSYK